MTEHIIQAVIGRCPECGTQTESWEDDGLAGLLCGRGHEPIPYVPAEVYYRPAGPLNRSKKEQQ